MWVIFFRIFRINFTGWVATWVVACSRMSSFSTRWTSTIGWVKSCQRHLSQPGVAVAVLLVRLEPARGRASGGFRLSNDAGHCTIVDWLVEMCSECFGFVMPQCTTTGWLSSLQNVISRNWKKLSRCEMGHSAQRSDILWQQTTVQQNKNYRGKFQPTQRR